MPTRTNKHSASKAQPRSARPTRAPPPSLPRNAARRAPAPPTPRRQTRDTPGWRSRRRGRDHRTRKRSRRRTPPRPSRPLTDTQPLEAAPEAHIPPAQPQIPPLQPGRHVALVERRANVGHPHTPSLPVPAYLSDSIHKAARLQLRVLCRPIITMCAHIQQRNKNR